MDNVYTIQEVATKLNVSDKTLRRWEEAGKFSPSRTLGNQRRYSLEDLQILDAIKHGTVNSQKDLLSANQASKLCGVSQTTLLRWENLGKIHPFITSGNTYYPRQKLMEKMDELKKIDKVDIEPTIQKPIIDTLDVAPIKNAPIKITELPGHLTPLPNTVQTQNQKSLSNYPVDSKLMIINIIITLSLLLSYHLITNTTSSKPVSPQSGQPTQTGSVQGVSTFAPDSRLDDLIVKFEDHLSSEMLKNARPTLTTVKVDNASLIMGTAIMKKGTNQISVSQDKVTSTTPLTATFTSDYAPAKKYWVVADQGSFTLYTDFPVSSDSSFNYSLMTQTSTDSAKQVR